MNFKTLFRTVRYSLCLGVAVPMMGCNSGNLGQTLILQEAQNNSKISVALGTTVVARLPAIYSTGYEWLECKNEPKALKLQDAKFQEPEKRIGQQRDLDLFFKPPAAGEYVLCLNYMRAWEKEIEKMYRVQITVP
jgi:predicted secreted protein